MKFPVKYSTTQKLKALALRVEDRSIPFSERSQAEDQYKSIASGSYAKGGMPIKGSRTATNKATKMMAKGGAVKKASMSKKK
jgi:hypothetical protein